MSMNIESIQERLLRAERERDEALCEVERLRNLYDDAKQSANAWRSVRGISKREHELERQLAEARAEIQRMRETESDELRAARDDAIRLGQEAEALRETLRRIEAATAGLRKERDEARAEVTRLRADNEQMIWNLAGISTIACAESLDHYVSGGAWERPALADTARLVRKLQDVKAEIARLRASQNERAIEELSAFEKYLRRSADLAENAPESPVDLVRSCAVAMRQRMDALRAEQAAAPAPVTPPADAPQRPSDEDWPARARVDDLRHYMTLLLRDSETPNANAVGHIRAAVRLLLDDALAARGGA